MEDRAQLLNDLRDIKKQHPQLKVLVTEVKEASDVFGLIPDRFNEDSLSSVETIRLLSYSKVIDSKSGKIHTIEQIKQLLNAD